MTEEEYRQHVNKMNENIGNILKDHDEELMFYVNLVKRFNDICDEKKKKEETIDKAIEFANEHWGSWCAYHLEYMTELLNILNGVSE